MPGIRYRELGRTGSKISEVSLGTEHLRKPPSTVAKVVRRALDGGINYLDLVFNLPDYLRAYGNAIEGRRGDIMLSHHLGSAERNGRYMKTREPALCEKVLNNALSLLKTDYIDVANVHFVKTAKEYADVAADGGVLDLASHLKEEGLARFVGISTHDISVVKQAAESGRFDVVMFQINLANNSLLGRDDALAACMRNGVGVLAMKPFAGGRLLMRDKTIRFHGYLRGGSSHIKQRVPDSTSVARCLSYTLSQIGVSSAVAGVRKLSELDEILSYGNAAPEEKDFSGLLKDFQQYSAGECVYCDHCLPCPMNIEIGEVLRLLDATSGGVTARIRKDYGALGAKASDCNGCGACSDRCPFSVDVEVEMQRAKDILG
ncbi:MAG: aldo/keto reductase [Candidatus Methanomethylicus sp.]|nr:aldo/keto reductase [Candidatus Methanomethylicus sp.]